MAYTMGALIKLFTGYFSACKILIAYLGVYIYVLISNYKNACHLDMWKCCHELSHYPLLLVSNWTCFDAADKAEGNEVYWVCRWRSVVIPTEH